MPVIQYEIKDAHHDAARSDNSLLRPPSTHVYTPCIDSPTSPRSEISQGKLERKEESKSPLRYYTNFRPASIENQDRIYPDRLRHERQHEQCQLVPDEDARGRPRRRGSCDAFEEAMNREYLLLLLPLPCIDVFLDLQSIHRTFQDLQPIIVFTGIAWNSKANLFVLTFLSERLRDLFGTNTSWLFPQDSNVKVYNPNKSYSYLRQFSITFNDFGDALDELARALYDFSNLYHDEKLMLQLFSLHSRFKAEANTVYFDYYTEPRKLSEDIQRLLEVWVDNAIYSLKDAIKGFHENGVPAIGHSQNNTSSGYLTLSTIAFFLSGTTASMLQVSADENTNASGVAANTFLFSSLVFSIASAVSSLLVMGWHRSVVRMPDGSLPLWLKTWMRVGPMISLLIAGAFFSVALCLFVFASGQHTVTSAVTIAFSGFHASGLLFLSGYFILQRWRFRENAGAVGRDLTKDSVILSTIDWANNHLRPFKRVHVPNGQCCAATYAEMGGDIGAKGLSGQAFGAVEKSVESETMQSESPVIWHALSDEKFILNSMFEYEEIIKVPTRPSRRIASRSRRSRTPPPRLRSSRYRSPSRTSDADHLRVHNRSWYLSIPVRRRRSSTTGPTGVVHRPASRSSSVARLPQAPGLSPASLTAMPLLTAFMAPKEMPLEPKTTLQPVDRPASRRVHSCPPSRIIVGHEGVAEDQILFARQQEIAGLRRSQSHPPSGARRNIDDPLKTTSTEVVSSRSEAVALWLKWVLPDTPEFREASLYEGASFAGSDDVPSIVLDLLSMGEEDFKLVYGRERLRDVKRQYGGGHRPTKSCGIKAEAATDPAREYSEGIRGRTPSRDISLRCDVDRSPSQSLGDEYPQGSPPRPPRSSRSQSCEARGTPSIIDADRGRASLRARSRSPTPSARSARSHSGIPEIVRVVRVPSWHSPSPTRSRSPRPMTRAAQPCVVLPPSRRHSRSPSPRHASVPHRGASPPDLYEYRRPRLVPQSRYSGPLQQTVMGSAGTVQAAAMFLPVASSLRRRHVNPPAG